MSMSYCVKCECVLRIKYKYKFKFKYKYKYKWATHGRDNVSELQTHTIEMSVLTVTDTVKFIIPAVQQMDTSLLGLMCLSILA